MGKRTRKLYQDKCLGCGCDEFYFSTLLQINHKMGKKKLDEVFGGEVHTRKFGKDTEPYKVHVGWEEFHIPFKHDETYLELKIECSNCGIPINNKITYYAVSGGEKPGIVIQSKIKTVLKKSVD